MIEHTKLTIFWSVLLALVGVAWFFASPQPHGSRVPWPVIIALLFMWGLRFLLARIPISPEMATALARLKMERQRCRRCGTLRRPNDVFCNTCHPRLPLVIGLLAAAGLGWAAWLLLTVK